jgi:hypothetical protein
MHHLYGATPRPRLRTACLAVTEGEQSGVMPVAFPVRRAVGPAA